MNKIFSLFNSLSFLFGEKCVTTVNTREQYYKTNTIGV